MEIELDVYRMIALRAGLKAWHDHKMKLNRMYTPARMMALAEKLTGKKFKPRDYMGAHKAISALLEKVRAERAAAAAVERIKDDLGFGRAL